MQIDESQEYSVPVLDILEQNLEAAINKVRLEKERKINGEMGQLQNMVITRKFIIFCKLISLVI